MWEKIRGLSVEFRKIWRKGLDPLFFNRRGRKDGNVFLFVKLSLCSGGGADCSGEERVLSSEKE